MAMLGTIIVGTAVLAVCHLLGVYLGDVLGWAIGAKANVGGVGIAMLMLILVRLYMVKKGILHKKFEDGVNYWAALYIPVVVAMAATQNVVAALRGGHVAVLAAVVTFSSCFCIISFINRMESKESIEKGMAIIKDKEH
jgi:malonate transporter MadL subunit